jgi:hypothetical protein
LRLVSSACEKRSKTRACAAGESPSPVSRTSNRRRRDASPAAAADRADLDDDPAGLGEPERVADEVEQHLPERPGTTPEAVRGVRVEPQPQVEALRRRGVEEEVADCRQQVVEVERDVVDREAPRLQPGEVEHVVDQAQEPGRGAPHRRHDVALVGVERGGGQHLAHADDGVQRRAELVAHGGQEVALRPARLLGQAHGVGQLAQSTAK